MYQTNFKPRTVARQTREDSVSDSFILVNEHTVVMEDACTWSFLFDKIYVKQNENNLNPLSYTVKNIF